MSNMSDPYRDSAHREQAPPPKNDKPWELQTWTSDRTCPACGLALFAASKDGYRIDACGKCGGSWMAHADVRKMIDTSEKAPIELARLADSAPTSRAAEDRGSRACPECKSPLVREVLGGAEIDVCDRHGTWFDRTELEQVAMALIADYGVARRVVDAEAERKRQAEEEAPAVSFQNVAFGVAAVGLALVGAAISVPIQHDAFGREIVIDPLGNKILKRPPVR